MILHWLVKTGSPRGRLEFSLCKTHSSQVLCAMNSRHQVLLSPTASSPQQQKMARFQLSYPSLHCGFKAASWGSYKLTLFLFSLTGITVFGYLMSNILKIVIDMLSFLFFKVVLGMELNLFPFIFPFLKYK